MSDNDAPKNPPSIERLLYAEPFAFDFFQAVRLLERLQPDRQPLGFTGPPDREVVRLAAHPSLDFPPSAVMTLDPEGKVPAPRMTVTFLGLTGPSGVLPRHYTEMLMRLLRDARGEVRYALRDWLDLFNHRLAGLFYRAWDKYRFYIAYERKDSGHRVPDAFTRGLFSLVGLGTGRMRDRLRVSHRVEAEAIRDEQVLGRIDDLALLRWGGFLSHRPRNAVSLEALLSGYLKLEVRVEQFEGRWLRLDADSQTALSGAAPRGSMGVNVVVGERVWDVQGKIRVRLGPMSYARFAELLPDTSPVPQRKLIFLVAQLVRLYVGIETDVDIQLVLKKEEVPACKLGAGAGARLGWNTWSRRKPMARDADDAVFQVAEGVWVDVREE